MKNCFILYLLVITTGIAAKDVFKVVTANVNIMPQDLNILTSGSPSERASQIAEALLTQQPQTDVYVLQELYDEAASNKLIELLKKAGFDYFNGPTKDQLEKYWKKKGKSSRRTAKNSGQAVFVKKDTGLQVDSYEVFPFINAGIEGIGVLEAYLPKGVIHIKISRKDNGEAISIFAHHLQAELGFFAADKIAHGELKEAAKTIASDIIHLQPSKKLRETQPSKKLQEKYPSYVEEVRKKQIQAAVNWINQLKKEGKVADQLLHIGDFNLIAGTPEYARLLKTLDVVPVTDKELVTICNPKNTTWNKLVQPAYIKVCKYINNYGWMDLGLVNADFKKKVNTVDVVDLKNKKGKSVTDHSSVSVTFDKVFEK